MYFRCILFQGCLFWKRSFQAVLTRLAYSPPSIPHMHCSCCLVNQNLNNIKFIIVMIHVCLVESSCINFTILLKDSKLAFVRNKVINRSTAFKDEFNHRGLIFLILIYIFLRLRIIQFLFFDRLRFRRWVFRFIFTLRCSFRGMVFGFGGGIFPLVLFFFVLRCLYIHFLLFGWHLLFS